MTAATGDIDPPRGQETFRDAWSHLLPNGRAWPRERDSVLMRVLLGLAGVWAGVDARARILLYREALPDRTVDLLRDWERVAGLPDPCVPVTEIPTLDWRRERLVAQLTAQGGQSRRYFLAVAYRLGHLEARIDEFSPFRAGRSRCGSMLWRSGSPLMRFWWRFFVGPAGVTWFRAGKSRAGRDPQADIARAWALECLIRRWKPAHTEVLFTYRKLPDGAFDLVWFRAGRSRAGRDPQADIIPA